jgi:hypothetical protein
MNDLERIKYMEQMNWKPAQTYWKEQYDKLLAKCEKEKTDAKRPIR